MATRYTIIIQGATDDAETTIEALARGLATVLATHGQLDTARVQFEGAIDIKPAIASVEVVAAPAAAAAPAGGAS